MIHKMKLFKGPYEKISAGHKTVELRLNDEKRRKIQVGDTIIFTEIGSHKHLPVKVNNIYKAECFEKLFYELKNNQAMGFDTDLDYEAMVEKMRKYYTEAEEKDCGVVGIDIVSPRTEIEYPVLRSDIELKYVVIIAVYQNQVVFCKHKKRNTLELPGGHIEAGETTLDAAKRELYEETGINKLNNIVEFANYFSHDVYRESKGAYGTVFLAEVKELPESMPEFEMESISLKNILPKYIDGNWKIPELPTNLTHYEIYSVLLYCFQNMTLYNKFDRGFIDEVFLK